jgi:hypothetical protein
MPRRKRLDFNDAIQYVCLRGRNGAEIFFDPQCLGRVPRALRQYAPHAVKFEAMLADICAQCGTLLHAYCLEPNSGILVLRTIGVPLHASMQRLCGSYSLYLRARGFAAGEGVFGARYDSRIIAPEYLPHAVRRAHRSPIVNGLCGRRLDYPFSSERAYSGEPASVPLETASVKMALQEKGYFGLRGYLDFMDKEETSYVAKLFSEGSPMDSRIVGDKVFVQQARYMVAHPRVPPTREQLVEAVARLMGRRPADIFSATHIGVLGRALVAWYGLRSGAATLSEMGRWFSVTGATLGQAMRHHCSTSPDLFKLAALPGLEATLTSGTR